jgi:hypothetical protein
MKLTNALRLVSLFTGFNVIVASGFTISAVVNPHYLVPAASTPTEPTIILGLYAVARTVPLALFALAAIYKRAVGALLILGSLAGCIQLLDAGIGFYGGDISNGAGPLFIAVLEFIVMYLLYRSVQITPQTKRGST